MAYRTTASAESRTSTYVPRGMAFSPAKRGRVSVSIGTAVITDGMETFAGRRLAPRIVGGIQVRGERTPLKFRSLAHGPNPGRLDAILPSYADRDK